MELVSPPVEEGLNGYLYPHVYVGVVEKGVSFVVGLVRAGHGKTNT